MLMTMEKQQLKNDEPRAGCFVSMSKSKNYLFFIENKPNTLPIIFR